jgi:hypothetical protein
MLKAFKLALIVSFVFWLLLALLGRALASEELVEVQTVSPLTDQVLVWVGVATVVAGLVANIAPPHWRLTQVFARLATDLRGIRKPDPRKTTKLPPIPQLPRL